MAKALEIYLNKGIVNLTLEATIGLTSLGFSFTVHKTFEIDLGVLKKQNI